ncbi:cofactor-independent phosphoglycerate mutase [Gemmata obscuriglobus]|uniref:Phosphoglycerate mutase n=1 Tax=Gemmata obscuriglobus TaxID=114 RepID=A0A2Z3H558_9BACT|nr:2,3-bisphosphoglycerate-independent phosphoglycerate mutase [Gemmata obscuriglobus]AWM38255.1 phosphoglycerate mutase [Gemmata obscuriglobus]QEG28839.1 cofactor-independent phosphoglycerate mutase [Gemmata obscuriglobus]VTS07249.1 phosphoglycerate mutase : Phosphoglycerate mutase OS=uncultured planctomycete GN=HGMM_F48A06C17 PE=4 SV=1: Metalloenzyme: PhosphMutase [Gemmata obscuriglobus UQM 2246]
MNIHELIRDLREPAKTKIVLLVADGLGGLPLEPGGLTELETARTPNLDACAKAGVTGLSTPVLPGITPGSGPGHLGLFGYDPLEYQIGRGILEALGINFQVTARDVAIRGNFCTLGADGKITDRRAGRPTNEKNKAAVEKLRTITIPGVELFVEPVKEHRFVLVIRGDGLGDKVNDTDPQAVGVAPLKAEGADEPSKRTAEVVNQFIAAAVKVLAGEGAINGATLRGFATYPKIATFHHVYGLKAAAIAVYPMYKGLARLVGMDILDPGQTLQGQVDTLSKVWNDYDFFFLHYKYTDSTGEDGNFAAKVQMIEQLDAVVPEIQKLKPDVFIVTGDHSTPSKMKSHSWHPVPTLLCADMCRTDEVAEFSEKACLRGGLGQFQAMHLMLLAMAHAGRLGKYGA